MPNPMSLQQFGQTIKAKHPEYADLADEDLAQRVLAKYPQYKDMVAPSLPAGAAASLPEGATTLPGVPTPSRNLNYVPAIDSPANLVSGAWSGIKSMVTSPRQTVSGMGQPFVASGMAPGGMYPATAPMGLGDTGKTSQRYNLQTQGAAQEQQGQQGLYAAGHPMETTGSIAGPALLTAGIAKGLKVGVPALKGVVTGDINATIPGTDVTPAQRYSAMRETGVQPDAAQATNSPLLRAAKLVNQNSLTSSGLYENARARNLSALEDYTNQTLNQMSPEGNAQVGGADVQRGLLEHQAGLKSKATAGFQALDQQVGNKPIPGAAALQQQAKNILAQNAPYYKLHPELEPTKAMAIVKDLARGGTQPKPAPKVIGGFGASAAPPAVEAPRVPGYTDLHRLRSDLLDFNNANPDLVKNQANAWISQLAGAADQAITASEGGLSPEQVQTFRDANEAWKGMKQYDNPQDPLYHAARSLTPSTLVEGINKTPEMAQNLRGILGEQGIGPIRRGVSETQLGTTPEGQFNFRTFQGKFNKLSPEYRGSLYTPEQQRQLGNIGQTGSVLNFEANPSGTAKLTQKIGEGIKLSGSLFNPVALGQEALYHGGQYGLGRAMNSPAVVDWLMRQRQPKAANANPIIPPIYGQPNSRR